MVLPRTIWTGAAWAAAAITIWSGSLVMLRLGVTTSLNAYDLTFLRFGVAAVILAPVLLRRGAGSDQLKWWGIVLMVAAFGAPYVLLLSVAMSTVPASAAGAINPGVMAIVTIMLGRWGLGERINGIRWIGLIITGLGLMAFTWVGGGAPIGYLILVVTGVMWASYALIVRKAAVPALNATAIVAVGSAAFYVPLYLFILPKEIFVAPLADIAVQGVFQGVLVSVVAIYAFNRSAECLGLVAGATLPAFIPVVTLALGTAGLAEIVGVGEFLSILFVTFGLILILMGAPAMRWLSSYAGSRAKRRRLPAD